MYAILKIRRCDYSIAIPLPENQTTVFVGTLTNMLKDAIPVRSSKYDTAYTVQDIPIELRIVKELEEIVVGE